ncbi:MAG: DUF115 domain-containing protein [Magnetococcales bacterium]|nr:DUF115 domain-containing protein [Magnetococcales bacterium]
MTYWHTNTSIVQQRWPGLWQLSPQGTIRHRIEPIQDGILVDHLHLFSLSDPWEEARLQAESVPPGATAAHVYGLGSPHLPQTLLARPGIQHLTVILLNTDLFFQSLAIMDHQAWLSDTRTNLVTWREAGLPRKPLATSSVALHLAGPDPAAKVLATRVRLALESDFQDRRFLEHPLLMERIRQNKPLINQDPGVENLFNTHPGDTILVAGAGPTLDDHLLLLANRPVATPLIAVDGALLPLRQADILPDIVVTMEHQPIVFTLFQDVQEDPSLLRVPLVYFPASDPAVLDMWPGPRYLACSYSPAYAEIRQQRPLSHLYASGSILHAAVDLAIRMGAGQILFVGTDFSFPGGQSHAQGNPSLSWQTRADTTPMLPNGLGTEVASSLAMNSNLLELEQLIETHPRVTFINAGRRGARIRGTHYLDTWPSPLPLISAQVDAHVPLVSAQADANVPNTSDPSPDDRSALQQIDADLLVYRYARAERKLRNLVERLPFMQDPGERILTQHHTATLALRQNKVDRAETLARSALETVRTLDMAQRQNKMLRIPLLRLMAQIHLQCGRSREAANPLEEARSLTLALGDAREKARTGRAIAAFLKKNGRTMAAKQQLQEVRDGLALAEKQGNPLPLEEARCLMELGNLTACRGSWNETREYFSQAFEIYQKNQENTAAAMARQALFTLRWEMQQALQLHPGDCSGHLSQTVRLFRQGRQAEGGEAMRRLIDCVSFRLENATGIDLDQINPLLVRILEAQQRQDLVQVADDLAHRLAPLLVG